MNRQRIRWIIALMTLALIGIITLQVYWISHDINLKEQQFEQAVSSAMNAIVDRVETQEAYSVLQNRFNKFPPNQLANLFVTDSEVISPIIITDTSVDMPDISTDGTPLFEDLDNADINIEFHKPGSDRTILRFRHRNYFHRDSISTHSFHESAVTRIYNDSAEIIVRRNEEKIKAKMEKLNEVMQQYCREFIGQETDLKSRIKANQLDTIILNELQNRGIALDYEYGVLNGNNKSFALLKCSGPPDNLLQSNFKTQLFPNDILSKPDYLILNFPGSINYVLASMWLMLSSSLLFTLIILFVFTYTIQVIIRQKKLSDIKSDFINNMTHEFKTPIATISLAVDSIKNPKVRANAEKLDYFTKIIREENKRMNAQVEHVLQMAQLDKGELHLEKSEVNLHDIIQHAVELILIQVESRAGNISAELNSTMPVFNADGFHLSNVIFNLLDNANKYSPEIPEIKISTEDVKTGVIIKVQDKGMGMTKDTQKKIFEKFYRVPTGNIHDIKGFGLGLAYVKAIVENHGGWINVHSESGKGSTFEIFIPR